MVHRHLPLDNVAPWLVSGASSLYIIARARRLSQSNPDHDSLSRFLVRQSDIIAMLVSSPALWYYLRRRHRRTTYGNRSAPHGMIGPDAMSPTHQLRQAFTALLLGTRLLARKASNGRRSELAALALRLHSIVHDGACALTMLDELHMNSAPAKTETRRLI